MGILHWDAPKSPDEWGRWNAKLVNKTSKRPHVEIRTSRDTQDILIVVSVVGEMKLQFGNKPTEQCNIRLSSNLPIKFSFQEWEELNKGIKEAIRKLKRLQEKKDEQV